MYKKKQKHNIGIGHFIYTNIIGINIIDWYRYQYYWYQSFSKPIYR